MFGGGLNYTKLKTNLRLAVNRLKLLEKKKMELTQKAGKEIAVYIGAQKIERAKIRVEQIIREDYLVEAMEMIEMFCDLLLARFGLLQQMKMVDSGINEAVSSVLYAGPRLSSDVPELKVICEQLTLKYGKEFSDSCRHDTNTNVSEKFKQRLGVQVPPKWLVEKYLVEISQTYGVNYEPDSATSKEAEANDLLDLSDPKNNLGGNGGGGFAAPPGFKGFPQPPLLPSSDFQPFNYPGASASASNIGGFIHPQSTGSPTANTPVPFGAPLSYNIPPSADDNNHKQLNYMPSYEAPPPSYSNFAKDLPITPTDSNKQNADKPKPSPRAKISPQGPPTVKPNNMDLFPELPAVPDDIPNAPEGPNFSSNNDSSGDIDFDDLSKRFEQLKKKK